MPDRNALITIFEELRDHVGRPESDFTWSSWANRGQAFNEIDGILGKLRSGLVPPSVLSTSIFLPTGPAQELATRSGWSNEFLDLADRFDDASATSARPRCTCLTSPDILQTEQELGTDSRFADVSLLKCVNCGQPWIRYHLEVESHSLSGRWYLGAIESERVPFVTAENALAILEAMEGYFYGGSYFGGTTGRSSGPIF